MTKPPYRRYTSATLPIEHSTSHLISQELYSLYDQQLTNFGQKRAILSEARKPRQLLTLLIEMRKLFWRKKFFAVLILLLTLVLVLSPTRSARCTTLQPNTICEYVECTCITHVATYDKSIALSARRTSYDVCTSSMSTKEKRYAI